MSLKELLAALREKQTALAVLKAKVETPEASEDDVAAFEKAIDEIEAIEKKINTMKRADAALAHKAVPAKDPIPGIGHNNPPAAQVKQPETMAEKIAVGIQALVHGHKKGIQRDENMVFRALEDMGYAGFAQSIEAEQKVASTTNAAGGFTIPDGMNPDVMEFLNPYTRFLEGGPEQVPMPQGSYRQPGLASQPTAAYRGEKAAIAASDLTFREINMKAKLLSSVVPVTNQIVRYSATAMVPFVQRSIGTVMGLKMDEKGFVGTGVGAEPLGILKLTGRYSTAAAAGKTPTAATVDGEARKLINRFAQYPLLQIGLKWVMSQRTFGYLQDLRQGDVYAYPTLQGDNPTWKGYPVLVSTVIVDNEGGSTNESTISLVSWGNILLGVTKSMEFAISTEATVNGVSMFETDQTAIRATSEHDWEARHDEDVAVLTGVQWGAP